MRAGRERLARANSRTPPPPPNESGRGAEPKGALGRTARRLSAAFVALFLITLACAPQDAQAQTPTLTATAGDGQVALSWTYTGSGHTGWGYQVNKGRGWPSTTQIPGSNAATRRYTVTGLTSGTVHQFKVWTRNSDGSYNAGSNVASATPTATLKPPTGLTVAPGPDRLYLSWTAPMDSSRTGWQVRYRQLGEGWGDWSAISGAGSSSHIITGLSTYYTYSVELRATDGSRFSTKATGSANTDSGLRIRTLTGNLVRVNEGGSKTYFISLLSRGTGPVTVTPSSANGDLSFNPTSLTFSITNWDEEQNMTVSAAGDTDEDDENATITYGVSGGGYPAITETTAVQIVDTGTSTSVTPTLAQPTNLRATAGNGQVSFTWTKPPGAITGYEVRYAKSGASWEAWAVIPGAGASTESHTVSGLDGGSSYTFGIRAVNSAGKGLEEQIIATPTGNEPTAGVTISPTSLTVEEGSSNTYMVKLDKAPSADVTITVGGASGDVTVADSSLTFTSGNYSTAQTITVRAARDGDTTDDTATLTHAASSSDTNYGASLDIDDVTVTVTDTTPTFQLSTDPAAVTEGTAISLTVTSDKSISGNWPVRLALAARSSSGFDADDIPGTLGPREFTANFGAATKTGTVTIPTSTDSATEGAEAYRITLSQRTSYVSYAVGADSTADGTLNDGTVATPVPAAPTSLTATAGNGQVVLSWSDPDNDSITRYEASYSKVGESWGAWSAISGSDAETTGHTVTSLDNGSEYRFRIRAVNSAGNGAESAVARATPVVPATAGVTLSATSLTVEEGSSNTYTVKLDKAPSANVMITVSGASGDVTVDGSPLTFTSSNFSAAQTITVRAAADEDTTDDTATLTHATASSDTDYGASLEIDEVNVTVTDTTPTLQLSTDPAAVTEGTDISLTVTSDQALTGNLTVSLTLAARSSSTFTAEDISGTLGPRNFTAAFSNPASTTGTVTIPTSTDTVVEGAEAYRITLNDAAGYAIGSDVTADGTLNDGTVPVPAAPTGLSASAGNGQVALSWTKPTGSITGYKLRYARTGDRDSASWVAIGSSGANTESHTVMSLDNDAEYSFQVRAVNASGDGAATGWVTATPVAPASVSLSIADATAAESAGTMSFTVTATPAPTSPLTFKYTVTAESGDTATAGTDFVAVTTATAASIAANAGTTTITVSLVDDNALGSDKTFTVTLSEPSSGVTISDAAATGTISDDDEASVTVSTAALTVAEGGSNTYTVKLDTEPTANVTVTVAGASGDVTVTGSSLTFTTANYNTAQTVTVNAAEDLDTATDPDVTLTHSAAGGGYGSVSIASVVVSVTENDTPPAPSGLSATAGNGQVGLTWSDPNNASITGYQVRYARTVDRDSASWSAIGSSGAATTSHTVTGLDNEAEYSFQVRAQNAVGEGAATGWVTATPVTPTVAGVTISTATLSVEEGASNTYTVKLDTAPSANVTITVAGASGEVTVAGSPLIFTPGNFGAAQTITVRAAADEDATDDTATLTHTALSSDTDYGASLNINDVNVTVTDTTPTLQLSTDPAAVTEGTDIRLTVTSDQALTGDLTVSLTLAARDSSGFTAEDIAGTLGPRNFTASFGDSASNTGAVTIPTRTDSAVEGAEAYRITLNDATGYAIGSDVTADGALNDGTVSAPAAPSGLTASAGNGQVVLSWSDPDDDSITRYEVRYDKTGERSSAAWSAIPGSGARTGSHAVTGLDNDAQYSFQLRAVNPSGEGSATDWVTATPVSSSTVALTIADVTAPESGTFTFTVSADAAPASPVTFQYTVTARSGDTATAGADFTAVTATTRTLAAGATRTTITVAVSDDERDESDETFTVILSEPSANATLANATATGTISDDDASPVLAAMADRTLAAGQAVDLTASATDGDGDSVSYAWTRKAGENTPALPEGTALNQARLRFTIPATATGRYTMTVTASDGNGNTDSEEVVITVGDPTPPSGEPPVETPVEAPTPVAGVTLSSSALTVEEGGSGNYTVVLDTRPTEEVIVTIGGAAGDVTATPASLTFTRANYSTAQTVTVTAAEDDDAVTDTAVTLTHSASGGEYGAVNIDAVTVSISEDDEAGVTLSVSTLTVEEGGSGNYTVVLDSQPVGGEVTVTPGRAGSSALTIMPSALRFTAANWNTAQMVTVTATRDDDTDDESAQVSHAVSGGDYEGVMADSVTVTVTDTPAAGQVGRVNRVNARVLPQVAAATLSQTLTAVTERIGAVASGQPGAALQFGALPQTLEEEWKFLPRSEPSTPSVSEMLDGATFALPLGMSGNQTTSQLSRLAAWGRGERVELSGEEQDVSWDGDLWSAHLGADMHIRPDLLAGAALSYAEGEVDTQTTESDGSRIAGTYETTLTAIHPYVSHMLADGSHLWGSMGYGQGEARIREGSATRKTDLSQWSVALGGRRVLLEDSQRIAGGLTRIALKGEGALARLDTDAQEELTELTVKTTRLRLLLEGSHERALQGGATVTPALEAGLRHDGGDLGSGPGLEAGASLTWRNPQAGWLAQLRARSLLAHEKDRDEWGISALVRVEPGADGRGLSLTFGPEYGHTDSGMERWFNYSPTLETANSAARDDREGRLEAELGYGIGVSRAGAMALLTPYTGFSLGQSGAETFRVGARYRLGEGLSVGIEGKHQPQAVGENSLILRAAVRW